MPRKMTPQEELKFVCDGPDVILGSPGRVLTPEEIRHNAEISERARMEPKLEPAPKPPAPLPLFPDD